MAASCLCVASFGLKDIHPPRPEDDTFTATGSSCVTPDVESPTPASSPCGGPKVVGMKAGWTCLSPRPQDINPPKPQATAHFGATQSPNEKRPLGSYPPALLPLGLRRVEPRGSLTLLRRRKAPGRTEKGGPGWAGVSATSGRILSLGTRRFGNSSQTVSPSHPRPAQSGCDLGGHSSSPARCHPGVAEDVGAHSPRPVPSSPSHPLRTPTPAMCSGAAGPTSHQSPAGQS